MEIIKDFNQIGEELTILDFFANWCGPCKMLSPILEEIKENGLCEVKKVDVDQNPDMAQAFKINSIPTLVLYKNKKPIDIKVGYMQYDEIEKWVNENK